MLHSKQNSEAAHPGVVGRDQWVSISGGHMCFNGMPALWSVKMATFFPDFSARQEFCGVVFLLSMLSSTGKNRTAIKTTCKLGIFFAVALLLVIAYTFICGKIAYYYLLQFYVKISALILPVASYTQLHVFYILCYFHKAEISLQAVPCNSQNRMWFISDFQ